MVKPYSGEELRSQLPRQLDWHNTYVVIVTGAKLNPCGHALLNIGAVGGYYFHVAEVYGHPRYMVEAGYRRYLREEGKQEIRRHPVTVDNSSSAEHRLYDLMGKDWLWGILPHNCAAFVEEVIQAGGSRAGSYSNCPSAEVFRGPL